MKKTEQRWMHISTGLLVERGRKPDNSANDYRPVTVTWDEPEYEDVEVVMWLASDGKTFLLESYALDHQATLTDGQIVELRGTYRRRKPEPQVENYCPSCGGYVRDIERKGEL